MTPPLAGIRVVDLSRLAPGPYCTMLLADMGAEVISVGGGRAGDALPSLSRGKTQINLDLKRPGGVAALHRLVETADVVVEGFRPGTADRIGAGFAELAEIKPDLVYCSITGWGQDGPFSQDAGHDINYLALSGYLGAAGPAEAPPTPPLNLLADFAGGGLSAAFGIMCALHRRSTAPGAQLVDAAMLDGVLSMMTMHIPLWGTEVHPSRGRGMLTGEAPFYRCYPCSDGRFVAVGAIEDAFFAALWTGLDLHRPVPAHRDPTAWADLTATLTTTFASRTRDEWAEVFAGTDACVTPVLDPEEAWAHPHVSARVPRTGLTPVVPVIHPGPSEPGEVDMSDRTHEVLKGLGLIATQIAAATPLGEPVKTGLSWPPPSSSPATRLPTRSFSGGTP